jgi:hypothetical protein
VRQFFAALIIALVPIALYLRGTDALYVLFVLAPAFVAVGVAALFRKDAWKSALIAAGVGFGMAAAFWLYAVISVGGSGPSCDGFCLDQWQARVFVTVVLLCYASVVAATSGILALIFCRGTTRAVV